MTDALLKEVTAEVPDTLQDALDPEWLTRALADLSGGSRVVSVELAELIKTMASKARIVVRFENDPDTEHRFCLKAFLDDAIPGGGPTTIREADFYAEIAPQITMRVPHVPAAVIDRVNYRGILVMDDLVAAGATFCSAFDAFTADEAAESLDQIARLHVGSALIAGREEWVPDRMAYLAEHPHYDVARQQELLDDPRSETLDGRTRNAGLLLEGMRRLAARNADRPATLLHGDCHAGNLYRVPDGPGFTDWQLLQRGNWALDVAYHMSAVMPVDVAAANERHLLDHYLDARRALGDAGTPDRESAWEDYRAAQIYGFYHWAITRRTDPAITKIFMTRLGAGVARHDSYTLLGL